MEGSLSLFVCRVSAFLHPFKYPFPTPRSWRDSPIWVPEALLFYYHFYFSNPPRIDFLCAWYRGKGLFNIKSKLMQPSLLKMSFPYWFVVYVWLKPSVYICKGLFLGSFFSLPLFYLMILMSLLPYLINHTFNVVALFFPLFFPLALD